MTDRAKDLGLVGMLVLVVSAVGWALSYGFDPSRAGEPGALGAIAGTYAALGVGAALYGVFSGRIGKWLIPGWGDITLGFFCGLVLFGAAYGFKELLTMHQSPRAAWLARIYLQLGDPKPLRQHQGWVGAGIFVMAFLEEIVWRGWVQSVLDRFTRRYGWVLAAVLYAAAHVPTLFALSDSSVGPNPVVLLGALGAGLAWGALVRIFGRLWPAIVCHALFDWGVLMMFRLWGPSV